MKTLLRLEFSKLFHLSSVRVSLVLLAVFPIAWAYAPGVYDVYRFYLVSGYQLPGLTLLSSMEFLLPLLVAIASAELLGLERTYGTLPTVLLRPVTRSRWLLTKLLVALTYPFLLLSFLLLVSLASGVFFGYGAFVGGTGVGEAGLLGQGTTLPGAAIGELLRAYTVAAFSLVPISLLAVLFTVVFVNAAGGALATLAVLIFMKLLVVFPGLGRFLLTEHLDAYAAPSGTLPWAMMLLAVYAAGFAALAVTLFERKDF